MDNPLDSSPHRAASHLNMIDHLAGPLTAGAGITPCPIQNNGRIRVKWVSREPLMLIAPLNNLDLYGLRVDVVLNPGTNAVDLDPIYFVRHTEALTFLPVYRPPVDNSNMAKPFVLALTLFSIADDGTATRLTAPNLAKELTVHMVEGLMGRMLYLLGAEKGVLRRMMRELAVMRQIDTAHDHALDMLGADLSVPRFADQLIYQNNALITETRREPDSEYRRRLKVYFPWVQSTPTTIRQWLNGAGEQADDNQGLLSELGLKARFNILEQHNPFAIGIRIFATEPAMRNKFFDYLRRVYLIHLDDSAEVNTIHSERYVTQQQALQDTQLRNQLRQAFQVNTPTAVAPALAVALDRLRRVFQAINININIPTILRAFDADGGSRYELGLGVDLASLSQADITALTNAVTNQQWNAANDSEIERLLLSLTPIPSDVEANWLFNACGLRTVHRLDAQRIYVSHFPSYGLVVNAANPIVVPLNANPMEVYYEAPGLPQSNVVLETGLNAALDNWIQAGNPAWTVQTPTAAQPMFDRVVMDAVLNQFFAALALPGIRDPQAVTKRLQDLPPELFKVLVLPPTVATEIVNRTQVGGDALRQIVRLLRDGNIVSVLPFVTDTQEVLLAVGVLGLPEAGLNLSDRRPTGFRWYAISIYPDGSAAGTIKSIGSRTFFTPATSGITAAVVLGYARHGLTDPYEFRVDLPDGALLAPLQYEFLMNLLERLFPMGIEINTYALRQHHVDLDGDGTAEPLLPTVFRTYRRFVRPRHAGQEGVPL